jgi:hypothetical protein
LVFFKQRPLKVKKKNSNFVLIISNTLPKTPFAVSKIMREWDILVSQLRESIKRYSDIDIFRRDPSSTRW